MVRSDMSESLGNERIFLADDNNWLMSQSHFRRPVLVVRGASTGPRAQQGKEPGVVCAHTGADHAGVPGNRGIPAGASHASCVGRNHPNVIQGDQMSIQCC